MKHLKSVYLLVAIVLIGCTSTQRTITYKTLYTVEKVTVAAYDGYVEAVIKGVAKTNEFPKISTMFNQFQQSFLIALTVAEFNTNAPAPVTLLVESQTIVNTINKQ